MKTPQQKYENDPHYHALVDMLQSMIHEARFTPSELREACIYAATRYEMFRTDTRYPFPYKLEQNKND